MTHPRPQLHARQPHVPPSHIPAGTITTAAKPTVETSVLNSGRTIRPGISAWRCGETGIVSSGGRGKVLEQLDDRGDGIRQRLAMISWHHRDRRLFPEVMR